MLEVQVYPQGEEVNSFKRYVEEVTLPFLNFLGLKELKVVVDLDLKAFASQARIVTPSLEVKLSELAEVTEVEGGVRLLIKDEAFAPLVLSELARVYGWKRLSQPSRLEVIVEGVSAESFEALVLKVEEPHKLDLLVELLQRLAPEGFRIVELSVDGDLVSMLASEDPLSPVEKALLRARLGG